EKADPSFIPSYYFMNEIKGKDGNVYRVPSLINDRLGVDDNNSVRGGYSNHDVQQAITQGVVQQETIVPQQGTMQINNNSNNNNNVIENEEEDGDSDDGFFYA